MLATARASLSSEAEGSLPLKEMTKLVDRSQLPTMSDPVRRVLALQNAASKEQTKARIALVRRTFEQHAVDTGSSRVQGEHSTHPPLLQSGVESTHGASSLAVAVMTVKMEALQRHLNDHPKDHSTQRRHELLKHKRRRMLSYMKRTGARATSSSRALRPRATRVNVTLICLALATL